MKIHFNVEKSKWLLDEPDFVYAGVPCKIIEDPDSKFHLYMVFKPTVIRSFIHNNLPTMQLVFSHKEFLIHPIEFCNNRWYITP